MLNPLLAEGSGEQEEAQYLRCALWKSTISPDLCFILIQGVSRVSRVTYRQRMLIEEGC